METTENITEILTTNLNMILSTEDTPTEIRDSLPQYLGIYICHIMIGITGTIGNGLVLMVILNTRSMWDATNLLIANQSLIDFFGSLSVIVFRVIPVPPFATAGHVLKQYLCFVWYKYYFIWMFNYASILNLVFISFERFFAVRYPIRYRNNSTVKPVLVASVLAWLLSAGYMWFLPATSRLEDGVCRRPVWPTKHTAAAVTSTTFLIFYLFPLIIMSTIYRYIGLVLKRGYATKKFQDQEATGQTPNAPVGIREIARRKVIRTMVIVTITSILCWTPSNLLNAAYVSGAKVSSIGIEHAIAQTFQFANNSINPFIYTFNYHKFQGGLRRLLRLRDLRNPTGAESDRAKTKFRR